MLLLFLYISPIVPLLLVYYPLYDGVLLLIFLPQFVLDWLTCGISSNDPHSAQNSNHITINDPCSLQIHSKLATLHYSYSISSLNETVHLFWTEQKNKAFVTKFTVESS